tara:strand:- start:62 stop:1978 length:1917 start_codon:yes stop_codon:yes gene_type:complete
MSEEEEKRVSDDYNERKLKEELDRYERQNQEAYDKEVSGENFLKDRAKENEEDEPDAGDIAKGVSFEVAAGLATDKATSFLLNPLFGPKGIFLYGLANFASGSVANIIAQRLRGDTSFSLGEVLSSGAAGIIPGTQLKAGKAFQGVKTGLGKAGSLKRAAISGGLTGVGAEQIRVGIDEGRFLTAQEALLGGAVGGTVSTGMQSLFNAGTTGLKTFNQYLGDNPYSRLYGPARRFNLLDPQLQGTVGAQRTPQGQPQGGGFNWGNFGYKIDRRTGQLNLPTLVKRAKETGNIQKEFDVSEALYTYYTELDKYIKRRGTRRGFAKFINPDTGEVYNPAFTKNTDGSVRFSLSNARLFEATRLRAKITRGNLDERYSSSIQKQWKRFKVRDRIKMNQNEVLLASDLMDQKKAELLDIQTRLGSYQKNQLSMLQRQELEAKRIEVSNQIQSLKAGTYYGEHGYAINSKVWNSYALQKRYPGQKIRFEPGDAKNFHLIYEPDSLNLSAKFEPGMRKLHQTFKKTKDNFDSVIEDPNIRYPDHVVHLNPNFEPDNAEKIIRIERLDSVRIGNEVQGQMSGDAVAKFDWKAMGSRVWSKAEIRAWLASYGIVPVGPKTYKPNPAFKKTRGKRIITDPNINPKKK